MALIYVVEDDKNIREIESFALKNAGYEIQGFVCAKDFYTAMSVSYTHLDVYKRQVHRGGRRAQKACETHTDGNSSRTSSDCESTALCRERF